MKIDPANQGVKIRRRVNRNRSNVQRTDVYVDGRLIADALGMSATCRSRPTSPSATPTTKSRPLIPKARTT